MPQWRLLQIGRALYTMQWILFNHVNVKQSFLQEACLPVKRTWGLGSVGCLRPPALLPYSTRDPVRLSHTIVCHYNYYIRGPIFCNG